MRLGIIGAGRIGANHARILSGLPGVSALINRRRGPRTGRAIGGLSSECARQADVDAVFGHSEALVIASSTDTHAAFVD